MGNAEHIGMTDKPLYVRVRGKVIGPFGLRELLSLRDRGQFRRFHEISEDRKTWLTASTLAEVFPSAGAEKPGRSEEGREPSPNSELVLEAADVVQSSPPSAQSSAEWFYVDANEKRQGPVSKEHLLALREGGAVKAETPVWKTGMSEWAEFASVNTLASAPPAKSSLTPEDRSEWRRVQTGITLVLLGVFITIGTGFLVALALIVSMDRTDRTAATVALFFGFIACLTGFSAQILETVGFGFCAAAPAKCGNRGLATITLVLGIACSIISLLLLVLLLTSGFVNPERSSLFTEAPAEEATAAILIVLDVISFGLWLAKPFFFQFFLRAAAVGLGAKSLAQNIVYLLVFYGIVALFLVVFFFIPFFYPRFWLLADLPGGRGKFLALVGLLMITIGFYLAWLVWYIAVLFKVRGALSRNLPRE
jgi:hypothetical protein